MQEILTIVIHLNRNDYAVKIIRLLPVEIDSGHPSWGEMSEPFFSSLLIMIKWPNGCSINGKATQRKSLENLN